MSKSISKRFEITSEKQLTGYVDNYRKCNMCREADWASHPLLFKRTGLVKKPTKFHSEKAKQEVSSLPDKHFSSYCRACSMGRTIKRKITEKKEITCQVEYDSLILDWIKQIKLTYCHNVLAPNKSCNISIPTEIAVDISIKKENEQLKAKITKLETDLLVEKKQNKDLANQISDLRAELDDHKTSQTEIPEDNLKYAQDIYDRIFAHKTKRNWSSAYWRLTNENFSPILENLKHLGVTVKKIV